MLFPNSNVTHLLALVDIPEPAFYERWWLANPWPAVIFTIILGMLLINIGRLHNKIFLEKTGIALIPLAIVLYLVSTLVETNIEYLEKHTATLIHAGIDGINTNPPSSAHFSSLLDKNAKLLVMGLIIDPDRQAIINRINQNVTGYQIKSANLSGIKAYVDTNRNLAESQVTIATDIAYQGLQRNVDTTWRIQWKRHDANSDWRATSLNWVKVNRQSPSETMLR